jgi:DNA-binding NtrC family response regulator
MSNKEGYLAQVERITILAVLRSRGGRRLETADFLGISERCLRNKLTEYRQRGFDVPSAPVGRKETKDVLLRR